jgi:CBS domain-containing protein
LRSGGCCAMPVEKLTASEVMTSPAVVVREEAYLVEIAELLNRRRINRLPVTDSEGRLTGIITRSDIVSATLKSGSCTWNT